MRRIIVLGTLSGFQTSRDELRPTRSSSFLLEPHPSFSSRSSLAAGCASSGAKHGGAGGHVGGGGNGGGSVVIGSSGCPLFTPDDAWNLDISGAAVDTTQTSVVAAAVGTIKIHPDFGPGFGIPFNVVASSQKAVP